MDFSKSKLNQYEKFIDLVQNIDKLFANIIDNNNIKLNINYDRNKLMNLKNY